MAATCCATVLLVHARSLAQLREDRGRRRGGLAGRAGESSQYDRRRCGALKRGDRRRIKTTWRLKIPTTDDAGTTMTRATGSTIWLMVCPAEHQPRTMRGEGVMIRGGRSADARHLPMASVNRARVRRSTATGAHRNPQGPPGATVLKAGRWASSTWSASRPA